MNNKFKKYSSYELEKMFDNISYKYDLINNILSLGIHTIWKKQIIFYIKKIFINGIILDIACGTGDMCILLAKNFQKCKIIGLDLSECMINIGKKKILNYGLDKKIKFIKSNVENIPFRSNNFDIITISFGIRNFEKIYCSLKEIYRVLNYGGYIIILEFSMPNNFFIKKLYYFYSLYINNISNIISNYPNAYNYLTKSIKNFPYGREIEFILEMTGFSYTRTIKLTFGIASIYIAKKIIKNDKTFY